MFQMILSKKIIVINIHGFCPTENISLFFISLEHSKHFETFCHIFGLNIT